MAMNTMKTHDFFKCKKKSLLQIVQVSLMNFDTYQNLILAHFYIMNTPI